MVEVIPGLYVWRCTEAIDPRAGSTFRTIGNPDGRCLEIISSKNQMLFDRRLARKLAETILSICGPEEALPSDLAEAEAVEAVYGPEGFVVGFRPFVPPSTPAQDPRAFITAVRADAGLPDLEQANG